MKCTHPTNEKDGICAICRNIKFKLGNSAHIADTQLIPASRSKTTKKHQGTIEGGKLALSSSYSNKKLKLFAKAQISYLLSLAYQGNVPVLIKRLHLLQRNLRNGNF